MAAICEDRVRDTTTTTGTGAVTVSGTPPVGYVTFSTVCTSPNDTLRIVIVNRDVPSEWEVSNATYSAANQLTRTTIENSSNGGAAVNFSAGTKDVIHVFSGTQDNWIREKLTASRTYYVRADGSDSNTGLADTAAGAFLTLQKAVNVCGTLDLANQWSVTISLNGGSTYAGAILSQLLGTGGTSGGAFISCGSGTATISDALGLSVANTGWTLGGGAGTVKILSTNAGIFMSVPGVVFNIAGGVEFGACTNYQIYIGAPSAYLYSYGTYTITGAAAFHLFVSQGNANIQANVTLSGTLAFTQFAYALNKGYIYTAGITWTGGTITGQRYLGNTFGYLNTGGAGANHFPGNVAGSVDAATFGLYQ